MQTLTNILYVFNLTLLTVNVHFLQPEAYSFHWRCKRASTFAQK